MMREDTRKKIHDYEATPPRAVWERISSALDSIPAAAQHQAPTPAGAGTREPLRAAATPLSATAQPPASGEREAPPSQKQVLPSPGQARIRRIPSLVKYAAALLLLAGAAIIWQQLSRENTIQTVVSSTASPEEGTGITIPPPAHNDLPDIASRPNTGGYGETEQANDNGRRHISTEERALRPSYINKPQVLTAAYRPDQSARSLTRLLAMEAAEDDHTAPINRNYFYLTSGDGQQVRISRKLAAVMLGELGLIDPHSLVNSYEIQQLTEKIRAWKTKLSGSAFVPSASNLMDLLSLIDMQEEQ